MPLDFELRPATRSDLDFCWTVYRDAMKPLTEALGPWNEPSQQRLIADAVADAGTSILRQHEDDAGWLQVEETRHIVHLQQLFVLPAVRNRGLGTSFLTWMKERAERKRKDLTLEVMTNNPARRLYERLGFKPISTANNKITMRY
ncbi:MAG TPA: GNAT family N-acetyltransferase [Reyranella sp.]|jgi:ribosomal protein S18 acetylase RimI-like enzyme|nr:GNAT family N-acetyltransferase [Reyranella sp.]